MPNQLIFWSRSRRKQRTAFAFHLLVVLFAHIAGCGGTYTDQSDINADTPTLGASVADVNDSTIASADETLSISEVIIDETESVSFKAATVFCCNPLSIEFSVVAPDAILQSITSLGWDFGDGRSATGSFTTHTYPWRGTYTVTLAVRYSDGREVTLEQILEFSDETTNSNDVSLSPAPSDDATNDAPITSDGTLLIAHAGPDQVVHAGDHVTLVGGSDAAAIANTSYSWQRTLGPRVDLLQTEDGLAAFVAPTVTDEAVTLSFRLTVTSDKGWATDDMHVTVLPGIAPAEDDVVLTENVAPTALPQTATSLPDQPLVISLVGQDADGDVLTFSIVDAPEHGALSSLTSVPPTGARVSYTPAPGFTGSDQFSFVVHDGQQASQPAEVRVDVIPHGDGSTALGDEYLVPVDSGSWLTLRGFDAQGLDLTFVIADGTAHGTLGTVEAVSSNTARVFYTPAQGFRGSDQFVIRAHNGDEFSNEATITILVTKTPLPWLELNANPAGDVSAQGYDESNGSHPGWTVLDYCVAGLNKWAKVTNTAIITTSKLRLEREDLYPVLMQRKPANMRILGGIKTSEFIPGAVNHDVATFDFADANGWAAIAAHAQTVARHTGENIVVLENETAAKLYHDGVARIDFARLRQSLVPLASTGIEFWWYIPQINYDKPEFPDRFDDTVEFVRAVIETVPNSKFVTLYTTFSHWKGHRLIEPYRDAMIELVGLEQMTELLYATRDGNIGDRDFYTPAQAIDQMENVLPVGNSNVVYTGGADWILVAEDFANILPHLNSGN